MLYLKYFDKTFNHFFLRHSQNNYESLTFHVTILKSTVG